MCSFVYHLWVYTFYIYSHRDLNPRSVLLTAGDEIKLGERGLCSVLHVAQQCLVVVHCVIPLTGSQEWGIAIIHVHTVHMVWAANTRVYTVKVTHFCPVQVSTTMLAHIKIDASLVSHTYCTASNLLLYKLMVMLQCTCTNSSVYSLAWKCNSTPCQCVVCWAIWKENVRASTCIEMQCGWPFSCTVSKKDYYSVQ